MGFYQWGRVKRGGSEAFDEEGEEMVGEEVGIWWGVRGTKRKKKGVWGI